MEWLDWRGLSCISSPGNLKNAEAQAPPRWPALNFDKISNGFDTPRWEKVPQELALACLFPMVQVLLRLLVLLGLP